MKIFFLIGVVFLSIQCCSALPQLVGIVDGKLLKLIDNLNGRYPYRAFDEDQIKASAPGCNYDDFASKFTQWTVDAGLPQDTNYTSNGQALKDAVNAVFAAIDPSNKNAAQIAMDKFCIVQRNFFQSLGVSQIGNCIYAAALVSNGYDRVSAFQTQQVFNSINYQCGAAFKTYTDYIDSYLSAGTAQQTDLSQCATDFVANLMNASSTGHGCPEMQTYEHCVGKVYRRATQSIDLAWTVCEGTRRNNVITLPACRDSTWFCQLSQLTV